ncbi:MAG TPA: acetyltransferase [Burkholderiaceae bacterium]|jgi:sugar O-acyltransferase (sialic acid O-acetyltransferase NeuD family)|nr:acetyltransferase [Burkholderiaceae bacterium]HOS85708.1 acetyltransferase [Burkholderiaceae bacterium]HPL77560.1 acetyltransferase [Burkholderiaceae bacterium]
MLTFGLVGAGGFGREVMPFARESLLRCTGATGGELDIVFVDDRLAGQVVNGVRVLSLADFEITGERRLFNIAVADAAVRRQLAARLRLCAEPASLIAPNVVIGDGNSIAPGVILCPFTNVTSNASIGEFFHCNIYSYVAHDCVVGAYVTFAPAVRCNGAVTIGDDAYVGTSAVLRQGSPERPIHIGARAVVGMGAVVTRSVPDGMTVVGNPARAKY